MLRIGFNLLYLIPGEVGGVETYARELLAAIGLARRGAIGEARDVEIVIYVSRSAESLVASLGSDGRVRVLPFDARNRYVRYLWEQLLLPLMVCADRIDVLHSLCYVGPLLCTAKSVVTIHDANHIELSRDMTWTRRFGLGLFSRLAGRWSTVVVTPSEFSKEEVTRRLLVEPRKVRAIHSGFGWSEMTLKSSETTQAGDFDLPLRYSVAIGGGYRHKNIDTLVGAFLEESCLKDECIVIVGKVFDGDTIRSQVLIKRAEGRVQFLGYLPTEVLMSVISKATLFIFPSRYEGFGFPVLEAQACGVPAACSRAGSIPEVAGDAACYFSPDNRAEIASVCAALLGDPEKRLDLVEKGHRNLLRFSWGRCAETHLALYASLKRDKRNR